VPAGFFFLMRRPRLWPLAALPSILVALFLAGGLVGGAYLAHLLTGPLDPSEGPASGFVHALVRTLLAFAIMASGMIMGIALALLVCAPVLDRLSCRIEEQVRGSVAASGRGVRWELMQAVRGAFYFVLAAPGVLLLGLIPIAGPVLGSLWGAHYLALQETEGPLARRGLDFKARRRWHRARRAESLGFGLAGLVPVLFFPFNLVLAPLVTPSLAAGATLLVLRLESGSEETIST
jgi:CysZ protein